ncbi:hypothetical protein MNV49_003476 [Pseudohyphozyma bogoriensis]|nr:hypothetical protein MNV49_003476 [Pseudohyphozyma bogoriensis]
MDWIKAEIDTKKRALDSVSKSSSVSTSSDGPATKYIKRGDLERQRVEEARLEAEAAQRAKEEKLINAAKKVARAEESEGTTLVLDTAAGSTADVESSKPEAFNVSNEEAVRRLRKLGQPIRLFGETDKERRLRLRALELIEERTEGQRNDFMRAMEGLDKGVDLQELAKQGGAGKDDKKKDTKADEGDESEGTAVKAKDEDAIVDMSLVKTNPHKIYPQIYHALKKVLKEWEQSLLDRPEAVRRSTQGKIAAATQQTSADYLKPLFKSLRKRDLAPDVLQAIAEITYNMQIREYLRANDAYLRLSIGNAPWPIGVTMTSRKYIQSLKRLLTFAQTVRPPADVSQKMG